MRTFLNFMILNIALILSSFAMPTHETDSAAILQREVKQMFKKTDIDFDGIPAEVKVGFLINGKNEIVVFDMEGDSAPACGFVKEVLNFKKVKYNQARQLTRYTVTIHLVKDLN